MSSPSPNKTGPGARRLWLAGDDCAAPSPGAAQSSLARQLLSELASRLGMVCPAALWSPRGRGRPHHPNLPPDWYAGISHSKGRVIVGLAQFPFGLDLERATPRHANRIEDLIDTLPEPSVRDWIRAQPHPLAAFYQAWTLYEALFKLSAHSTHPAPGVFSTRLHKQHDGLRKLMLWQGGNWTLAIASELLPERMCDPALLFPELQRIPLTVCELTHK